MNLLREEYCKEINTPMGFDDVYDYVKWLEKKLTETNQALQLQQAGVSESVCEHDFITCGTKAVECTKCKQVFKTQ